jgi:hypothetical protein
LIDGVDHAGISYFVDRAVEDSFPFHSAGIWIGGEALGDESRFCFYRLAGQQAQRLAIQRVLFVGG